MVLMSATGHLAGEPWSGECDDAPQSQQYQDHQQGITRVLLLLILPVDEMVAKAYGNLRALLAKRGQPIGNNDLFIAAHARSLGAVLVTNNLREFKRVPDLSVENWL